METKRRRKEKKKEKEIGKISESVQTIFKMIYKNLKILMVISKN